MSPSFLLISEWQKRDGRFSALILGIKQFLHQRVLVLRVTSIQFWESQNLHNADHQILKHLENRSKYCKLQLKSPCSPCRPSTWSWQRTLRSAPGARVHIDRNQKASNIYLPKLCHGSPENGTKRNRSFLLETIIFRFHLKLWVRYVTLGKVRSRFTSKLW